jgi:hypothetical protein
MGSKAYARCGPAVESDGVEHGQEEEQRHIDPLEPAHIQGQNPATPERMPGHTQVHDDDVKKEKKKEKAAAGEAEKELDEALEHTFPASDPISAESTLVPGGRR